MVGCVATGYRVRRNLGGTLARSKIMARKPPIIHVAWDYGFVNTIFGPTRTTKTLCKKRVPTEQTVEAVSDGATCHDCAAADAINKLAYKKLEEHVSQDYQKEKGYEAEQ